MNWKKYFNIEKAILYTLLSAFSFSIMALFVKSVASHTNTSMIVLSRFTISLISILFFMVFKKIKKEKISIKTKNFSLHFLRSFITFVSILFLFFALKFIPLVDGTLLINTSVLFIPILGLIFLSHKIKLTHSIAIIIGFIGIILVIKPGHELFNIKSVLALLAGLCASVAYLSARELNKKDSLYICMFYYFFLSFLMSLIFSFFYWRTPNLNALLLLTGIGIFGTLEQGFLILALKYGRAKLISLLMYSSLVFSAFLGWIFFNNLPDIWTWSGITLVCLGNFLIILIPEKSIEN